MYEITEVFMKLNHAEVQQALGIWLDDDAPQALYFIKEKIIGKIRRNICKSSAGREMAPCHLTKNNCACCRSGIISRSNSALG